MDITCFINEPILTEFNDLALYSFYDHVLNKTHHYSASLCR